MPERINCNATSLAAAVIRQAVVDLEDAYKKVKYWDKLAADGELRTWVRKKIKQNNYKAITFRSDDATALQLFKEGEEKTDMHHLMFSLTNIEFVPSEIREKRDWLEQNIERLQGEINRAMRGAKRDIQDEKM